MVYLPVRQAVFAGLVFDEEGQPVETAYVGTTPCYVIMEAGFRRHVESEKIDRQVLTWLHQQVIAHREVVTQGMLAFLGKDDLFTKAMIDASLQNIEENISRILEHGLPEGVRAWLGILGFRITVNIHGEVVRVDSPGLVVEE